MPASQESPCFWTETVRLLGLFEKHREDGDNANAAACFSRLAYFRAHELRHRPSYDPTRKSIVSIFQPKSGGTFLHNRMLQLGYQEFWWCFPDRRCHSLCYASDEALATYLAGGCATHTHARPDPNILAAFDRAGVDKIWVHLRNPAETAVSAYHHFRGEGHGEGPVGDERRREALAVAPRLGLHADSKKSTFVREQIGWCIEWITDWLRFADDHPGLIEFSYFDELADPQALFATSSPPSTSISTPKSPSNRTPPTATEIAPPPLGAKRFPGSPGLRHPPHPRRVPRVPPTHAPLRLTSPSLKGTGPTEHGRRWRPGAGR